MDIKKNISNILKLNGMTIRSDGIKYLCGLLGPINQNEHEKWIDKIIDAIQRLPLSSSVISEDDLRKAAEDVSANESQDVATLLQVIDIYNVPNWKYSIERKKFLIVKCSAPLHGDADDKASVFRNRYSIVYQRATNHNMFSPSISGASSNESDNFGLVKIEYLLGLSSKHNNISVLGLLTQLVEGEYHLEDDTGVVKIDLSHAKFHKGLFTQNSFVLLEGWFEDAVLHANAIGLPPAERAQTTRALLGNINYFGGSGETCAKSCRHLQEAEEAAVDSMLVFISDLWLDKIQVMEKINSLLTGYTLVPPTAFIFCGNFLSTSHGPTQFSDLKTAFASLADIITGFPEFSSSKFIFVPGPNDPGPGNIYPRPPIPLSIREEFDRRVPNSEFATNPCRLLLGTQEIVIFREDIFTKMCRNAIFFPDDATDIPSHFARTLISEAHLSPLPLHTVPIFWGLDHCLSLNPTPDLVVTADKGDPFSASYNSALVINPGSFMKTDFSFKVYMPASKTVEDSQVGDDT